MVSSRTTSLNSKKGDREQRLVDENQPVEGDVPEAKVGRDEAQEPLGCEGATTFGTGSPPCFATILRRRQSQEPGRD